MVCKLSGCPLVDTTFHCHDIKHCAGLERKRTFEMVG